MPWRQVEVMKERFQFIRDARRRLGIVHGVVRDVRDQPPSRVQVAASR